MTVSKQKQKLRKIAESTAAILKKEKLPSGVSLKTYDIVLMQPR